MAEGGLLQLRRVNTRTSRRASETPSIVIRWFTSCVHRIDSTSANRSTPRPAIPYSANLGPYINYSSCFLPSNLITIKHIAGESTMPENWQIVARKKKDEQSTRIPKEWILKSLPSSDVKTYLNIPRECGILSQEEIEITEKYDATGLAEAIRAKKLKSVDVVRAFCKVRHRPRQVIKKETWLTRLEGCYRASTYELSDRNPLQGCSSSRCRTRRPSCRGKTTARSSPWRPSLSERHLQN